jgi:cell division protease FtsH
MPEDDNREEGKRGFPGGAFLLLLAAVLLIMVVQSVGPGRLAKVGFSYQLEHLVNLDLLRPDESWKTALNDNLVSFGGQFREQPTDVGRARYRYLELLDQKTLLGEEQARLQAQLKTEGLQAQAAAGWAAQLAGKDFPKEGLALVSTPAGDGNLLALDSLPSRRVVSAPTVQQAAQALPEQPSADQVGQVRQDLDTLVAQARGPLLGIGVEPQKTDLRNLAEQLDAIKTAEPFKQRAVLIAAAKELSNTLNSLFVLEDGVRLAGLRSVRDYVQTSAELEKSQSDLLKTDGQLDAARVAVGNPIWYFRDQELSSRQLERQDSEQLHQWFTQAKQEWESFAVNRGLPFRAPDQPRNLVLERTFRSEEPSPNYFGYVLTLAPVLLLIGLLYFVFNRQMKGVGGGAMNFGKAPVKMWQKGASKVTFKDVAGIEEAKEELTEIVDFLKDPSKFTALGARIPRGALLIGPPGTGKTLMAKAVAGEADRPFFSISGSDFVEMFVGVGASRIRDLFDQAKKNAPCIVFIDEIDAVGRHRGAGYGGGHDEREQTLNQLLVEMDGFGSNEGIILMAATNRPDVLDKALLRPGRFDRRIVIDLPDVRGRLEILKVHAQRVKMDPTVDLTSIARATPGASGADLANILNEAALLAARKGRTAITATDVAEACDKVRYGKERRSLELDEKEKKTTAYHETGHAMVGLVVAHSDPVEKVTIVPRGMSLGATHFLPEKNKLSYWRNQVVDQLAVLMGGRAAEEIFVGDVSSGAQQDIRQATGLARSMVCEWGMSDELGLVAYDERNEGGQYLGMTSYREKNYSEVTAERIDAEVKKLLDEAYERAKSILTEHREQVETMTSSLMEFESLDAEDVKLILAKEWDADEKRKRLTIADQRFKRIPPPVPPARDVNGDLAPAT